MLLIHDLGELIVERDAYRLDPGGAKPRTILALLCAFAGAAVPASTLITEVWGEQAPERTQRALESQIWRLRKALCPGGEPSAIVTERAGYRLDLNAVAVDSVVFEASATTAGGRTSPEPADLTEELDAILTRWRGEPYTTAGSTPAIDRARRRLHAVRAALLTRRAGLLLSAGQYDRALDEAQALITRDPLDEHAWALKIRALASSGQRAEAFTAYRDIRELLATELGVEPGDEVRAAHRTVLNNHSRAVRRVHLPSQHTSFVGRDSELATLVRLLETERAVSVTGIPGVGKTRLALEAARRAADAFDDGVWFIRRTPAAGTQSVATAVDDATTILATLRIQPSIDNPVALDQVCEHLATMSALLILDGPANQRRQPETPDSTTTTTVVDAILERCAAVTVLGVGDRLGVDGEHEVSVHPLPIDPLADGSPSPAQRLLVDRIRVAVGTYDPDPTARADLDRICRAMGGLPLGLELAAARTATFDVAEVADQLNTTVPEPVTRAFTLAFESMDDNLLADVIRLTTLRSPFTPALASAVCDSTSIADDLTELTRRSILWPIRGNRHRPTRFTMLDTVADHARSVASDAVRAALDRRDTAMAQLLLATPTGSTPTSARDLARVDDDHATVVAFLESVVADPALLEIHVDAIERLGAYWYLRRRLADGTRILRTAVATAMSGECTSRTTAVATLALGSTLAFSQLTGESHRYLTAYQLDDLDSLLTPGDPDTTTHSLRLTVAAMAAWTADDHALALQFAEHSTAFTAAQSATPANTAGPAASGGSPVAAIVTATQALCELTAGEFAAGIEHAHTALALGTERGDPLATYIAAVMLGISSLFEGDTRMGLRWNDQAFHAYMAAGGVQICDTMEQRANHLTAAGEIERAGKSFAVARRYATDGGLQWPRNPFTHDSLRRCRESDADAFERGWRDGWSEAADALSTNDHQRFSGV